MISRFEHNPRIYTKSDSLKKQALSDLKMPSTIMDAVNISSEFLRERKISSHRLDAEIIVAKVLNINRIDIYLLHDRPISDLEWKKILALIERRGESFPTAYITGEKEFRSIELYVSESVLIPRPETELLVDEALSIAREFRGNLRSQPNILEIGTGSGAISLALSLELDDAKITVTDVSNEAIKVANLNFKAYRVNDRIKLLAGDLYGALKEYDDRFDIIVSNPPYVSTDEMRSLPADVKYEPEIALFGGIDGLDITRPLIEGAPDHLEPGGFLVVEIGKGQSEKVKEIISKTMHLKFLHIRKDYSGHHRVLVAKRM